MLQDALPRPSRDPEHLLRLRDKALARMAQDEALVSPPRVTRRWFTLAAGAAMAAPRAFAGTLRNAAPQYGAPGLPGNPPLPTPPPPTTARADLALLASWSKSSTYLATPGKSELVWGYNTAIKTAYYQIPSGGILGLSIIPEPKSGFTYIAVANQVFYVSDGSNLYGARFGKASLILTPSLLRMPTPPDGDAAVVSRFAASVSDSAIRNASAEEIEIPLTQGVPEAFWKATPDDRYGPRFPMIYAMKIQAAVLEFGCYSPYSSLSGTFSIDLKTKKLISFKSN